MNEPVIPRTPEPAGQYQENTSTPLIVYVLYLFGYFGWLPLVIGLVIAYINKADCPAWIAEHYRFQIRTFWISCAYLFIALLCIFSIVLMPLGWLLGLLLVVWTVVRCVRGILYLQKRQAPQNVDTWLY